MDNNEKYFDIRSDRWIKALRVIAMVMTFLIIIAGLVMGIMDSLDDGNPLDLLEIAPFFQVALWFIVGMVISFVHTMISMALIQLLDNVETLREKADMQ